MQLFISKFKKDSSKKRAITEDRSKIPTLSPRLTTVTTKNPSLGSRNFPTYAYHCPRYCAIFHPQNGYAPREFAGTQPPSSGRFLHYTKIFLYPSQYFPAVNQSARQRNNDTRGSPRRRVLSAPLGILPLGSLAS